MGNDLPKLAATVEAVSLSVSGEAPSSREAAAAVAISDTEVLLFGGGAEAAVAVGDEGGAVQFDDTWVLTLPSAGAGASWRRVETHGEVPCARTGHALVCVGGSVILVGGCSASSGFLSGAHVLDCATWTWTTVTDEHGPSPRDKLSAVAIGARVLVFGGFGPDLSASVDEDEEDEEEGEEDEEDDELEEGDGEAGGRGAGASFTWFGDLYTLGKQAGTWRWSAPATHGEAPPPRAAHGAAAHGGKLFLFGGRTSTGRVNDLYTLDAATMTWAQEAAGAVSPVARSFHTLASLHPHPLLVCFGGVSSDGTPLNDLSILDTRSAATWAQPQDTSGAWPPARPCAAIARVGQQLVVISMADADNNNKAPCTCTVLDLRAVCSALEQK